MNGTFLVRRDPRFVKGRDGLSPAQRIVIMKRTLDWLERYPRRATHGSLAVDDDGFPVLPHNPQAVCYCYLGRLCVEANIKLEMSPAGDAIIVNPLENWLEPLGVSTDQLIAANDGNRDKNKRFADLRLLIDLTHLEMPS